MSAYRPLIPMITPRARNREWTLQWAGRSLEKCEGNVKKVVLQDMLEYLKTENSHSAVFSKPCNADMVLVDTESTPLKTLNLHHNLYWVERSILV